MKKSDLKTGYLVKTIKGSLFKVLLGTKNNDILSNETKNINLSYYDEEMECELSEWLNIIEVYEPISLNFNLDLNVKNHKLIWVKKNEVEKVFNYISFIYRGTTVTVETSKNEYNFYVYVLGNKRARAFMDKQKLEKSRFEEVINILVKQLDESILLAFKL